MVFISTAVLNECAITSASKVPRHESCSTKALCQNPIRLTNGLWIVLRSAELSLVSSMLLTTALVAAILAASVCARWIGHASSGLQGKIRTVVTTDMEQDNLASLSDACFTRPILTRRASCILPVAITGRVTTKGPGSSFQTANTIHPRLHSAGQAIPLSKMLSSGLCSSLRESPRSRCRLPHAGRTPVSGQNW